MIATAAIVIAVLPLILLRGRTLVACWSTQLAVDALAWIVWRQTLGLDRDVWLVALAVIDVAIFSIFVARGANVRWSATRAALVAAMVYAVALPSMMQVPIDGDEPWYLLVTESLVHDRDLDLANQYRTLAQSQTGRTDLAPLPGDPVGPNGEQYSRHEPLLPLLMVPGYLIAGLPGALATIALFGALLARSTIRMIEDEGISDAAARAVFPFFAFAPPILFYSLRIWPEVPAAFFFVEAVRGVTQRRPRRWLPAILGLVLLKLRFVLIAVVLGVRRQSRRSLIALAIIAIPLVIAWRLTGSATNVHTIQELIPIFNRPLWYLRGLFGLILDGMSGIAFQAPFYLIGIYALTHWRSMPRAFREGMIASILYIAALLPRAEWHGGWAPPLRYVVVFMPILALGAAAVWDRVSPAVIAIVSAWTIALVVHGLVWPWRLFHIANGENPLGEWLSKLYASDFSRIFPSFIRPNDAAIVASGILIALLVLARLWQPATGNRQRPTGNGQRATGSGQRFSHVILAVLALGIAMLFKQALTPGDRIEFEDVHVTHTGGAMYPPLYTMSRFLYRGGWVVRAGDSMTFLARRGPAVLHYSASAPALIEIDGRAYPLPPLPNGAYGTMRVRLERGGRVVLRGVSGEVNLDRMDHE